MDSNRLTALGIDNYGRCVYRYGYEEIDYVDGTSDWVWNAPQHVFFLRLRELFDEELCALYTKLEGERAWSSVGLINQWNDWQAQFPEELWRVDISRKYIRTYTSSYINGEAKPEFLKERANGRKKTQRSQFERNQEKYMSSKFGGTVASSDDIVLRCSVPNTELVVPANFDITLTPYSYVYLNVKYNTSPPQKIRAIPGQTYVIEYDAELADIIEIYSASCLQSIGDLSSFYLINGDFSNARKIRELILGNATDGYNNTNSMTLGLGSNDLLNKLDIQNMSGLTSELNLSGLRNLEELYAFGSNVSGVVFADGGNISIAEIPDVGSLSMKNLSLLTDDGFEADSYNNLTKLIAEHLELDLVDLINNATNLYQVRLVGIDWVLEDTSLLERLYNLAGVTNTGGNADYSILSGRIHVPTIKQYDYSKYKERWSDLEITYGTMTPQFIVTFVNDDGTVLDTQYVDMNTDAVDPVTSGRIETPTKEPTVSTLYSYAGWNSSFTNIGNNKTIKAVYTESVREYTVTFVSKTQTGNEPVYTTTAPYGTTVFYDGETPVYTSEEPSNHFYLFDRWDKSGYVDGDKTITAIFKDCFYSSSDYFANKKFSELTLVEVYALKRLIEDGKLKILTDTDGLQYIENTDYSPNDTYAFNMGYDYDYDDIADKTHVLIDSPMVFDGTNYHDTGISLLEIDRDFVLAIDYEFAAENSADATLVSCCQPGASTGFNLFFNSSPKFKCEPAGSGSNSMVTGSSTNREVLIIRHIEGELGLHVYISNLSDNTIGYSYLETGREMITNFSLIFGCSKNTPTTFINYAKGTVHWAKLWYTDLGENACRNLASYIHEEVKLKIAGFGRYFLPNGEETSSIDFIGDQVLSTEKPLSSGSSNAGGWAVTTLRTWLNNRFYNGLPLQMKQMLVQVQVKSLTGNSSSTSTSNCYVYIPSITELYNSSPYSESPYADESNGVPKCLPFMGTNSSRIMYDANGVATRYWTRTPSSGHSTYFYYIQDTGIQTLYKYPHEIMGIIVEFSI